MLELKVEMYCQNCSRFDADVSRIFYDSIDGDEVCNTYISCKNTEHCRKLYDYIKGEINGKS